MVETYLYENVTDTFCLDVIAYSILIDRIYVLFFICSIYDVAVTCFFGGVLTSQNQNVNVMSYLCVVLTPALQNCMVTS